MGGIGPNSLLRKEADFPLVDKEGKARRRATLTEKLGCQAIGKTDGRTSPTDWSQINWRKAEGKVRNLRRRIFRAAQQRDWKRVKNLSKLMLRSYSNSLVSTRRVTQINPGRNTPGIDGEVADTSKKRGRLVDTLRTYQPWKATPVRRVYIPKANGKQRPLGIPTIRDRVLQAVVKNALEPQFEAKFEANSYGFRPGRSCQDATDLVFNALNEGTAGRNQWILDADIKGAFDHISHTYILNQMGPMPGRELVKQWLKAGYVEWGTLHQTTEGTPQGGLISPLLANIALDGIQALLGKGYRLARYADDFVVMAKTRQEIEQAIPKITFWLRERGLELNWEKTRAVHRAEGFHFLGFEVRIYGKKLLIKPQKEKVKTLLSRNKAWLDSHKMTKAEEVITYLNPILRGWALYYRYVVSKAIFAKVDHRMWWMLWNWARRRHPNKSKKWVFARYFQKGGHYGSTFYAHTVDRRGRKAKLYLIKTSSIPILRHVKVKGTASPDDPSLTQYWERRRAKAGRDRFAKGSKYYRIAAQQGWKCSGCGEDLFNGESIHLHHVQPVAEGGTDQEENLRWLHKACHYQTHRQRGKVA
jgi:RNA-directed DNA polymerase